MAGSLRSTSPRRAPTTYLLPGFIDAHVHVESSMLVPSEFARAAVVHGTVATVSDPHEIGNVLGVAGVAVHAGERGARAIQILLRRAFVRAGDDVRNRWCEITVAEVEDAARRSANSAISAK